MDPKNTYVLLIAVVEYPNEELFHRLPQAHDNIDGFKKILMGSNIGVPGDNIKHIEDPKSGEEIRKQIKALVAHENAERLIIYYAGHGVFDEGGVHYLTHSESDEEDIEDTGFQMLKFNAGIKDNPDIQTIVLLDSCFSENAYNYFEARNQMVIASSLQFTPSKYPKNEQYSAFTSELISILENGIDNGKDDIKWQEIFDTLEKSLPEKGFPVPTMKMQGNAKNMVASKNKYGKDQIDVGNQWVSFIQDRMGLENEDFHDEAIRILDSDDDNMENMLIDHLLNALPHPIAYFLKKMKLKGAGPKDYLNFFDNVIKFLFSVCFVQYDLEKAKDGFETSSKFNKCKKGFDEPDTAFHLAMLEAMFADLKTNDVQSFMKGFKYSDPKFQKTVDKFIEFKKNDEKDMNVLEKEVFNLIEQLDFLLNFKLISINDVNLNYRKYDKRLYTHHISLLHGDNPESYTTKLKPDQKWMKTFLDHVEAKNNKSVLFLDNTDPKKISYLNLWPLIIDMSVHERGASNPLIFVYKKIKNENIEYQNIQSAETKAYKQIESRPKDNKKETVEKFITG